MLKVRRRAPPAGFSPPNARTTAIIKYKTSTTQAGMLLKTSGAERISGHQSGSADKDKKMARYSRYIAEDARSFRDDFTGNVGSGPLTPKDVKNEDRSGLVIENKGGK